MAHTLKNPQWSWMAMSAKNRFWFAALPSAEWKILEMDKKQQINQKRGKNSVINYTPRKRSWGGIQWSICPSVRSFVRPSVPISNPILLLDRWTEFHETFKKLFTTWCHTAPSILFFFRMILGFPRAKQGPLPLPHMGAPISNRLLLLDHWTEFHETFRHYSLHDAILHLLF